MTRIRALVVVGELLALAAFVAGVAMIYVPAAFIAAGVLAIVVLERVDARLSAHRSGSKVGAP